MLWRAIELSDSAENHAWRSKNAKQISEWKDMHQPKNFRYDFGITKRLLICSILPNARMVLQKRHKRIDSIYAYGKRRPC